MHSKRGWGWVINSRHETLTTDYTEATRGIRMETASQVIQENKMSCLKISLVFVVALTSVYYHLPYFMQQFSALYESTLYSFVTFRLWWYRIVLEGKLALGGTAFRCTVAHKSYDFMLTLCICGRQACCTPRISNPTRRAYETEVKHFWQRLGAAFPNFIL